MCSSWTYLTKRITLTLYLSFKSFSCVSALCFHVWYVNGWRQVWLTVEWRWCFVFFYRSLSKIFCRYFSRCAENKYFSVAMQNKTCVRWLYLDAADLKKCLFLPPPPAYTSSLVSLMSCIVEPPLSSSSILLLLPLYFTLLCNLVSFLPSVRPSLRTHAFALVELTLPKAFWSRQPIITLTEVSLQIRGQISRLIEA